MANTTEISILIRIIIMRTLLSSTDSSPCPRETDVLLWRNVHTWFRLPEFQQFHHFQCKHLLISFSFSTSLFFYDTLVSLNPMNVIPADVVIHFIITSYLKSSLCHHLIWNGLNETPVKPCAFILVTWFQKVSRAESSFFKSCFLMDYVLMR